MGVLVLKTTVSLNDPSMPGWSELANDIVVNEKTVRCGLSRVRQRHVTLPFDVAGTCVLCVAY
jgi:hypothetical protein